MGAGARAARRGANRDADKDGGSRAAIVEQGARKEMTAQRPDAGRDETDRVSLAHDSLGEAERSALRRELRRGATRRELGQWLVAAGLGALAAGGAVDEAAAAVAATPKRGGSIRVAGEDTSTADTLDPARANNSTDYTRLFMFYSGLTVFDAHLTPQPELALSIDNQAATVWTIKLRKDVHFHDGAPFTSADVVYSLNRLKDPKTGSVVMPLASQMQEIKATAPDEVTITLASPNADLPSILAVYQFVIVKDGTTDFSKGIGTGPFRCKEFRPGVRSVGVRNPDYFHAPQPFLDEVIFFGIPDESARVNALLSGGVDIAGSIDPRSTRQVNGAKGYAVMETKAGEYTDLIMRLDLPQTGNPDFVMAMKYLQDRARIKSAIFLDYATIGNDQPVDPTNPYYCAEVPQRPFDPDRAKFHLNKSGMANVAVPIVCSEAATGSVEMALMQQEAGSKIGLKLDVRRVPASGYWSNYWLKAPIGYGNILPRPTANILLSLFFRSGAPWNESRWKDPKFDQLLLQSRAETDLAKRKQMYCEMQSMISDDAGIGIPVFISELDAYATRVHGLHPVPTGDLMGYNFAQHVWLE
jgi:peptide/nickel transport system substrate-binding protein